MGALSKFFGLKSKGHIGIVTDQPSYVAGEVVTGTIYVEVLEPFPCNAIILKAVGKEKTRFEKSRSRTNSKGERETYSQTYYGHRNIFDASIILQNIAGGTLLPGNYSYPYSYTLPHDIPGSCSMNSGMAYGSHASITYQMKAKVQVDKFFSRDLRSKREIIINGQALEGIYTSVAEKTKDLKFMCCFSKGMCRLHVTMDKNVYYPNEVASIIAHIENNSSVKISDMKCRLMQYIELRSNSGFGSERKTQSSEICKLKFPGVEPGNLLDQSQPVPLRQKGSHPLYPTARGTLITCEYYIKVTCGVFMCPDINLELPIHILALPTQYSGWLPTAIVQPMADAQQIPVVTAVLEEKTETNANTSSGYSLKTKLDAPLLNGNEEAYKDIAPTAPTYSEV